MTQCISILGCGWLGMPLAKALVHAGFAINGSTTSVDKLEELESHGITPFLIDINAPENIDPNFLAAEILIIAIPSKNVAGFQQLIQLLENSLVKKVIFISSTSVYPNRNQTVTETTAVGNSPLVEIEDLFSASTIFSTTILRFGGLIGYDRKPGRFIKVGKKTDHPEGYVNLIHRDDCIRIIELIIQKNIVNETLNACADTHPTRRAFYTKEVLKLGKGVPIFNENASNEFKIVSAEKLKALLDFSFQYADLMVEDL